MPLASLALANPGPVFCVHHILVNMRRGGALGRDHGLEAANLGVHVCHGR